MTHPPRLEAVPRRSRERLTSWKEIGAYLDCTVRTAQRWERLEALPVHRHGHALRDSVYAEPDELDAWQAARQATARAAPGRRHRGRLSRKVVVATVAVAAPLAVVAASWLSWTIPGFRRPALPFASRDWLLITDFDNRTGNPAFDSSLLAAFSVALEESPYANVLPRTRVDFALKRMGRDPGARIDEAVGREICVRENVKALVASGITKIGGKYAISARLVEPKTARAVRSYLEIAAAEDEILPVLAGIAARLRRDLGESLASVSDSSDPLPLVTTSSLEALEEYAQGKTLWRKGQYREAVKAWEEALRHDPGFAAAEGALAVAYASHVYGQPDKARQHYEKALRQAERITDRERLFLEASYEQALNHVEEATRDYRFYLKAYPDDSDARFALGVLLMNNHRSNEALEEFRQVVRIDPGDARAWANLATCEKVMGHAAEALGQYARAFELEPGWLTLGNLNHEYGFALAGAGDVPKAREVFTLARGRREAPWRALRSLALLDLYQGRYREATSKLRQTLAESGDQDSLGAARTHLYLALLLEGEGNARAAVGELNSAERKLAVWGSPALWLQAWIGAAYARLGIPGRAEAILAKIRARADGRNPTDVADLHLLEGELALSRRNRGQAVQHLRQAAQGFHLEVGLAALCRAYREAGDRKETIACNERFLERSVAALGWEPQQDWLAAHADLAEARLDDRDPARAASPLNELAALWQNADTGLPLRRRAEALLKRLEASRR